MIKIPHLGYPWLWDEARSYYPAIMKMAKNGPSLLPGVIELIDSKGHPLLFYYISSLWIKAGSLAIPFVRILPLFISGLTLIAFYFFLNKHFGRLQANFGTPLFAVQSLFLGQASLLLPEMLLTLLLIISFDLFMRGKYIWYAVFATLMSMTKETGLLFAGIFGLFFLAEHFRELLRKGNLKIIALLVVPLVVYLIFLFLQKKAYGTFFFTEHLGLITFKSTKVLNNLRSVSSNLATRYGRNIISLFALISLSVLLIRREKIANTRFMILAIFQVSALILFTILNFYTYRYILPAFPLFIAICLSLIYQARFRMKILNASAYILILAVPLAYSLSKKGKLDNDMGYTQYLKVHKMMVTWCEERGWSDRQFACGYNMVLAMRDPFTGYLHSEKGFRVAHLPGIDQADVVIYDSTCWDGDKPSGFPEGWKLVMRFEVKKHWGEIYVRDK